MIDLDRVLYLADTQRHFLQFSTEHLLHNCCKFSQVLFEFSVEQVLKKCKYISQLQLRGDGNANQSQNPGNMQIFDFLFKSSLLFDSSSTITLFTAASIRSLEQCPMQLITYSRIQRAAFARSIKPLARSIQPPFPVLHFQQLCVSYKAEMLKTTKTSLAATYQICRVQTDT